jgi:hypothetical protein
MVPTLPKQPNDVLDYDVDFSDFFPSDDTITTATAEVTEIDPDTDLVVDSVSIDGLTVKVWLSAGITGTTYKVTTTASTSGGRVKEQEFRIRSREY